MRWPRKWMWGCLVLALLVAGWLVRHSDRPQIITLSDGHQYRFVGASWGTNHVPPGMLPHLVNALPNSWANYLRAKLGPRVWLPTPPQVQQSLVIWLAPTGPNANVPFAAGGLLEVNGVMVDEKGVAETTSCIANFVSPAGGMSMYAGPMGPQSYAFLWFPVVPRRSHMLECQLEELSGIGPTPTVVLPDMGRLKFRNPLFGHYPQWQPEALPAVKSAGDDLKVRLNSFDRSLTPAPQGKPPYRFSLTFESPHDQDEKWMVAEVEAADATGNRVAQDVRYPVGSNSYGVYGALWPGEAAVRLTLTLKHTSGFAPTELVTFTNLPVLHLVGTSYAPTNGTSLTNTLGGIPIVVRNILTDSWHKFHAPWPGAYTVELDLPTHPPGVIGDIVEVTTDDGTVLTAPDSIGPYPRTYIEYDQGPVPSPKYLNVTVAVQKTRTVEFLVKP